MAFSSLIYHQDEHEFGYNVPEQYAYHPVCYSCTKHNFISRLFRALKSIFL